MKVTLKDDDGKKFDVGLEYIYNHEAERDELLFWIDSPEEAVTLKVSKKIADQIAGAIQFMKGNV